MSIGEERIDAQVEEMAFVSRTYLVFITEMPHVRNERKIGYGAVEPGPGTDLVKHHRIQLDVFEKLGAYDRIVVTRFEQIRGEGILADKRNIGVRFLRVFNAFFAEIEPTVSTANSVPYDTCKLPGPATNFEDGSRVAACNAVSDHRPQEVVFRLAVMLTPMLTRIKRCVVPFCALLAHLLRPGG